MSSPAQQNPGTPGPSSNGDNIETTNHPQQPQQTTAGSSQQQAPIQTNGEQSGTAGAKASNLPSQADIDKIVASYLQKKGYKATEAMFLRELGGNTLSLEEMQQELAPILKYKDAEEGDPDAYNVSYRNLREWIENSLDWYKVNCQVLSIKEGEAYRFVHSLNYGPCCFRSLSMHILTWSTKISRNKVCMSTYAYIYIYSEKRVNDGYTCSETVYGDIQGGPH